jgi:hypothetical protein
MLTKQMRELERQAQVVNQNKDELDSFCERIEQLLRHKYFLEGYEKGLKDKRAISEGS